MSTASPRPVLLPQNRKVRHLRGIYLRNLSFTRPRGRTTDDAGIHKSPRKPEDPWGDTGVLHHALSTESLRPSMGRRMSTNLLVHASTVARQKRLENAVDSRVADVFFSLHVEGTEDAIYVSETATRCINFNFAFFELSDIDHPVTRCPKVVVKMWAKRQDIWTLLIEDHVDLRALNWLGNARNMRFPPNALIFHLVDGVYSFDLSKKYPPPKQTAPLPTSSYNALMKLATLDNSIQDALATRDALAKQINSLLARTWVDEAPAAEDKLARAQRAVAAERRAVAAARKRRDDMFASLVARREAIAKGQALQEKAAAEVLDAREKLEASRALLLQTKDGIRGQRRRICEDLMQMYNMAPVASGPPLSFTICGVRLPNTTYDAWAKGEDGLSAALGHAALLTHSLQCYLGVPLPYPLTPFGSRSRVRDDISVLPDPATSRDFPLYMPRGGSAAQFRFEYAWFLLNKDIEALCASQQLKVVDIRHTLPNLKYLLFVCSAGSAELPARKRGGVRGLWAAKLRSIGTASNSTRSVQTDETVDTREDSGLGLPFDEGEVQMTLRTKGLRER